MTDIWFCTSSTVLAGCTRPITVRYRMSRRGACFGSNASGAQSSEPSGNAKRGGPMPTTWYGSPSIVMLRPISAGSPPKRRFQRASLTIAT